MKWSRSLDLVKQATPGSAVEISRMCALCQFLPAALLLPGETPTSAAAAQLPRNPSFTISIKSCFFLAYLVPVQILLRKKKTMCPCSLAHDCRRGTELLIWLLLGRLPAPSSCCCCLLLALAADSATAVAAGCLLLAPTAVAACS